MKYSRFPLALMLALTLTSVGMPFISGGAAASQGQSTALERGYRTGYSDGYNAGFRDVTENRASNYQNNVEYQRADRSYNQVWGPLEDYRDGYQQGFEAGYASGYEKRTFDSTLPNGFKKRGSVKVTATVAGTPDSTADTTAPTNTGTADTTTNSGTVDTTASTNAGGNSSANVSIPRETVLVLELMNSLSTDITQPGDRFQARVLQPANLSSAIVDGHVSSVKRPGKVKGVAQLQLTFDQIRFENRATTLRAQLVEVVPMGRQDDTQVDHEGGVRGNDSSKDDVAKVGAATGIGAIIGAIAGGGKGAAIGAVIGGGVGTAGVMSQRGKDIRLEQGQQLKIRTSTETNVL
jgi:hypothetical protein